MARDKEVTVDKLFTAGFISDNGTNKVPDFYARSLQNVRLENGGIRVCKGFVERWSGDIHTPQGITANEQMQKLLFVSNGKLYDIDTTTRTETEIGSIGSTEKARFENYGGFTLIFTGDQRPYVYDGTTLSQVTTIGATINPSFGVSFGENIIVNNNAQKNAVRVSRTISDTDQTLGYDWSASPSYGISVRGEVNGMTSTLSRCRIFTDKTIEFLDPGRLDSSSAKYIPVVFADGEPLLNSDCCISAGDLVFFVTKSKQIKVIGYSGNVVEPQMTTISDIENVGIEEFLATHLKEDQSSAFIHYDRINSLVKFWFVGIDSNIPDTCLIWDIVRSTRLLDVGRKYGGIVTYDTKQYAYFPLAEAIYEDETGGDFDGQPIEWFFETQNLSLTDPSVLKKFRQVVVAGQISDNTKIRTSIFVDEKKVFDKYIDSIHENTGRISGGIGSEPVGSIIGGSTITNQMVDFEKVVGISRMNSVGKKIKFVFSGGNIGQDFVLDYISMKYRVRARRRKEDKKFSNII